MLRYNCLFCFKMTELWYETPLARQVFVVTGAALNVMGNGCVHGFVTVLLSQVNENSDVTMSLDTASTFTSILGICVVIGQLLAPILVEKYGRQGVHMISTIPYLIGWLITGFACNVPMLYIARLMHGLGMGLKIPLVYVIIGEYASPKYRGAFLSTFAFFLGSGIFFAHFIGTFFDWRITAFICMIIPIFSLFIIGFSPESPCWLASQKRYEECTKIFIWLRGDNDSSRRELNELILSQKCDDDKINFNLKIIARKEFYKPALIVANMCIIFEFCGNHILPAYPHIILPELFEKDNIYWESLAIDTLRMLSSILILFLMKYIKRRTILFTCGILTVVSYLLISIYLYARNVKYINGNYIIISFLTFLYVSSFCTGLIPLSPIIQGEIFPLKFRTIGSTLSTLVLTPSFIISVKTAPALFNSIGLSGAYVIYSIVLALSLSFVYVWLPETKDRTLQHIERDLIGIRNNNDVEIESKLMS